MMNKKQNLSHHLLPGIFSVVMEKVVMLIRYQEAT